MSQGDYHIFAHTESHIPLLIVILVDEESPERRKHVAQLEGVQVSRGSKEVEIGELIMH